MRPAREEGSDPYLGKDTGSLANRKIGVDAQAMAAYWERYDEILTTPAARGPENFECDHDCGGGNR